MSKSNKKDLTLRKSLQTFEFYNTHMQLKNENITFPKNQYNDAYKVIMYYMRLIEKSKLHKTCSVCSKVKPVLDFTITYEQKLNSSCKECATEYYRNYREENAEELEMKRIFWDIQITERNKEKVKNKLK